MLWVCFAAMTSAVVLAVASPLWLRRNGLGSGASDIAFYRSLLAETDYDVCRGLVSPNDALVTRSEIGRRLLASIDSEPKHEPDQLQRHRSRHITATVLAVAALPSVALACYLGVGSPDQPDMPIGLRRTDVQAQLAGAIPDIEAHLAANPDDGHGLERAAAIYLHSGRFQDAARAYKAALRVLGENAQDRATLGQALVMAANGALTAEARDSFDRALVDDPKQPIARFFQGIANEQNGNNAEARRLWEALRADSPANAPWMNAVRQHLAALSGTPQPISSQASDGAARGVATLAPEQRTQAIREMVQRLADELATDGQDLERWLQLIRSYAVLGETEEAEAAVASARMKLAGDVRASARLDEIVKQLGLRVEH